MNDLTRPEQYVDPDDLSNNTSNNPSFDSVLTARLSRRALLKGSVGMAASAFFGGVGLSACSSDGGTITTVTPTPTTPLKLGFTAVPKSLADALTVPSGYTATVLYRLGDPIRPNLPDYKNDGTDTDFDNRCGDHHDGMQYFGLNAAGTARDDAGSERGLLVLNHENITAAFLHPKGATTVEGKRPEGEVDKEVAAHGVSVVEVQKVGGKFQVNRGSGFNRRITGSTPMEISGPARGHGLMKTKHSPDGTRTRGTQNNCANGYTPWGTYLTCEENWAGYFARAAGDNAKRSAKEQASFARYGISQGTKGGKSWATAGTDDRFQRWDTSVAGTSADGVDDYRNVVNTFGWVVEIDPYNPTATPKKRTALGRFAHECAWPGLIRAGQPLAFYSLDDSRGEYIYKFVTKENWAPGDAARGGMAIGDKYLDAGSLHVAKFNADGTGQWLPLNKANPAIASYSGFAFADDAEVLVNTRIAADAAGATKMDRPEWAATHPETGEIYMTLTNNSNRGSSSQKLDAANPRYYTDTKGGKGNPNGHIIRIREAGDHNGATTFTWDVFLFGAQAKADAGADNAAYQANVNLSGLTDNNDFSSPDGLWFSRNGLLWIQTDDGAYTDTTNCMMLAAIPGRVGDGAEVTVKNTGVPQGEGGTAVTVDQKTRVGRKLGDENLRRFLVGPVDCEITGITETPDGRALFVNIQHPGEDTAAANITDPSKFNSHWPDGGNARPRSATIVITRNDGGVIGI